MLRATDCLLNCTQTWYHLVPCFIRIDRNLGKFYDFWCDFLNVCDIVFSCSHIERLLLQIQRQYFPQFCCFISPAFPLTFVCNWSLDQWRIYIPALRIKNLNSRSNDLCHALFACFSIVLVRCP
eukprot:541221_1